MKNTTIKDDKYALPALLVAFGDRPSPEENGGHTEAPTDIPAHLARKLWENKTIQSGIFTPNQFRHLVENIIRYELYKLEK
jgi:hypothetical protein